MDLHAATALLRALTRWFLSSFTSELFHPFYQHSLLAGGWVWGLCCKEKQESSRVFFFPYKAFERSLGTPNVRLLQKHTLSELKLQMLLQASVGLVTLVTRW